MTGVQTVGARVEELLGVLNSGGFGNAAPAAEELVSLLVGMYGDGLNRIVSTLKAQGPHGAEMLAQLADDPLIESLTPCPRIRRRTSPACAPSAIRTPISFVRCVTE